MRGKKQKATVWRAEKRKVNTPEVSKELSQMIADVLAYYELRREREARWRAKHGY